MKAVVAQSPGVVAVQDVPEPRMGEYDALCAVLASAVCSGTDKNIVHNHPYHKARYPLVLGHEGVGRVIALGPKVRNLKIGDMVTRVINDIPGFHAQYGALAERALVRDWQAMKEDNVDGWQRHTIHRVLPEGFDPIDATLIITWRETFAYFSRMKPKARERLLIIGSGANALAFANHGKN
ncbi:MAG: alcohol dehydrogenase catalytic domain-containing protein, partial [Patescibacteria group bacterium]